MSGSRVLTAREVLADLFEEILVDDPEELATVAIQRLLDAGYVVGSPTDAQAALAEIVELIDQGLIGGEYLIGMIEGIARHGPRFGRRP